MQARIEVDVREILPLLGREGFLREDPRTPSDSVVLWCLACCS
jgi:hypothetical protein